MSRLADRTRRGAVRTWRIVSFVVFMTYEFVTSNLLVLSEILRPHRQSRPAIIELPLHSRTDTEMVSLANLVTLTPGTLTVEMFRDPPTLFVHGMFASDPTQFRQQLLAMERRMLAAMRPVGSAPGTSDNDASEPVDRR